MITPVLINRLGWKTYLIFMALAFSFVPIIYFFYPETSNYSLEEIDNIFLKPEDRSERSSTLTGDDGSPDRGETKGLGEKAHVETV
jgi:hypothetical protein